MSSEYFSESVAKRYGNFEFDFGRETLRDRVILLAGGAGGLGAATTALLLEEGARVMVGYCRNEDRAKRLREALGGGEGRALALCQADITQPEGRARLVDEAEAIGPVYGLVVFAGNPARGGDEDVLRDSLEINYLAPILLAREMADRMKDARIPGAIVLFSSMQGGYPFENSTAYGAAKAALAHAARVLAKESGGEANVRVNVVAPGATLAGMAQSSVRSGKYDPFVRDSVIPRFGRAEDVARTVRFLLEPDNYITGQVITVDGGLTLRRDLRGQ